MPAQHTRFLFVLISLCLFLINGCSQAKGASDLPAPIAQGYHHMAYDIARDKIILLPVQGNNLKTISSPTWIFDLNSKTWQKGDGLPWGEGPMAYDSQSDRAILFQGVEGSVKNLKPTRKTWAYIADTQGWMEQHPAESPLGIIGARMVYDSESDRIILFGGLKVSDLTTEASDTWAYDYETDTWTNMQPKGHLPLPEGENFFAMSYDIGADRVIVWRCTLTLSENRIGVYDYNSNTWEERETAAHPKYCLYNTMVYDPVTGLNILYGGVNESEEASNETWGYEYETNTWQLLSASNPPSARGWHAMVYDTAANVMLLFGGGPSRNEFTNELWTYDSSKNEWSNVMP